jgi:predicted O-methyltransferase YrrM
VAGLLDRCAILKEVFDTRTARRPTGDAVPVHSNIPREYAEALYRTVLANRPAVVLEVGMAFGVSALAILTALHEAGGSGRLISIDPNQATQWKSCGLTAVERAGLRHRHRLIEEFDYVALPRLLASGQRIDLAYIDGWHTFDYALLDFWFVDRMLNAGGVVGFNDCGFRAVDKVIKFVQSHRKYEEVDVGLPADLVDHTRLRGLLRRLTGRPPEGSYRMRQDRYFRKGENWEPDWDFFAEF